MCRCTRPSRNSCRLGRKRRPSPRRRIFCFPRSRQTAGFPYLPAIFVADHLRPAAKAAALEIPDGYRFGLHNLRHSLSSWLVNKGKAILRGSRACFAIAVSTPRSTFTPKATAMKHGLLKARFFWRWAWRRSQCNENVG